jgi:histidinol-phosphate aminotransferase
MLLDEKYKINRPKSYSDSQSVDTRLKLHKNENRDEAYTNSLLRRVRERISVSWLVEYPDMSSLYAQVAEIDGVHRDQLIFSAGADGIIRHIYEAFSKEKALAIYPSPTFAMYEVYSSIFNYQNIIIRYVKKGKKFSLDVMSIVEKIKSQKPQVFFLANPDSPTGSVLSQEEIELILKVALNVNTCVAIDEAYYPFHNESCVNLINRYSNLIVIRTFSKAWGLAGARVGYAISNREIIDRLTKIKPMYEIGYLSMMCALVAAQNSKEMLESVARLNVGKAYFEKSMTELGYEVMEAHGNFSLIAFGSDRDRIHEAINDSVSYRDRFSDPLLEDYARFSSTTKNKFELIVDKIRQAVCQKNV